MSKCTLNYPNNTCQSALDSSESLKSYGAGGIVAGPPEVFGGGTERVGPGFSARTAGI